MGRWMIAGIALALVGCGDQKPENTAQEVSVNRGAAESGGRSSNLPVSSPQEAVEASAVVSAYRGDWVPVDQSSAGYTLYVDRASIYPISSTRKRADVGYADDSGRTLIRIGFHCDEKMADRMDDGLGQVSTDLPDLVGDLPREEPHLSARDYVCFGKRSKPERDMPAIKEIPAVADG